MQLILSILQKPGNTSVRQNGKGDRFVCHSHHMKNGGLLEIRHSRTDNPITTVYRMDIFGEAVGIFEIYRNGTDELIYDRDSGFGDHNRARKDTLSMLETLAETFTEKEQGRVYA